MSAIDLVGKIILEDEFSGTIGDLDNKVEATKTTIGDLDNKADAANAAVNKLGMALAGLATVAGAKRIAEATYALTDLGARAETVAQAYENLTRNYNINGDALLTNMHNATYGAVSDIDLMLAANRALLAGGGELAENLPALLERARAASLATGQDIGYVFETLVKGIVKASPKLIDNAEIYITVGKQVDAYAAKLGKATEELTKHERQMAITNAVLGESGDYAATVGLQAETSAEQVAELGIAWQNAKIALGEFLIEAGSARFFEDAAENINKATAALNKYNDEILLAVKIASATRGFYDADYFDKFSNSIIESINNVRSQISGNWGQGGGGGGGGFDIEVTAETDDAQADIDVVKQKVIDLRNISPINIALRISGGDELDRIQKSLDGIVKRAASELTLDEFRQFDALANKTARQLNALNAVLGDSASYTWYQAQATKTLKSALDAMTTSATSADDAMVGFGNSMDYAMSNLRGDIERVLSGGLAVTSSDVMATELGTYTDKVLENARRLADIANKGSASPWVSYFEIPQDVLDRGNDAIKQWAMSLQRDVVDLTRPDLINWDAFVAEFNAMKQREAAKELTIDIAVNKLTAAGMLSGSPEERKKQVARMLGIEDPEMQFRPTLVVKNNDIESMGMALSTGVDKHKAPLILAGKRIGQTLMDGILEEVRENNDSFWQELANFLVPNVTKAIMTSGVTALP